MKKITFTIDPNEIDNPVEVFAQVQDFVKYVTTARLGPELILLSGHAELEGLGTVANYSSYAVARYWIPVGSSLELHVVTADGYLLNVSNWVDSIINILPEDSVN